MQIKSDFQKQRVDRPLPKAPEPPRAKSHWDYLLEEMAWLAKDMEKERRWKAKQAKRFVFAVVRGRHDLESRGLRQVRSENHNTSSPYLIRVDWKGGDTLACTG